MPSYNLYVYKKAMLHVANQTVSLWWPCHGSGAQSPVGSAVDQAPSRRPLTEETRFRSRVSPCEIYVAQIGTGRGFFLPVFPFFLSVSFQQCSILIYPLLVNKFSKHRCHYCNITNYELFPQLVEKICVDYWTILGCV
jgi:hypothetical protein